MRTPASQLTRAIGGADTGPFRALYIRGNLVRWSEPRLLGFKSPLSQSVAVSLGQVIYKYDLQKSQKLITDDMHKGRALYTLWLQ